MSLYVITKGTVDICFQHINLIGEKLNKKYLVIKNNNSIGELSFFTGQ